MRHIKSLEEGLDVFKALGSEIRIEIIKTLLNNNNIKMNELANHLHISNSALTNHIKKLVDSGLVTVSNDTPGHGNQKKCYTLLDKILIDIDTWEDHKNLYQTDMKVGHFSDYNVAPACGLASSKAMIGEVDDTRYFTHPDRYHADILWFSKGYVEYIVPNFIPYGQKIDQITISLEIGSTALESDQILPCDITFYINSTKIAMWTSPSNISTMRGIFTPDWWQPNWSQFGFLKIIVVNKKGSFIDGLKASDITIQDFDFDYRSNIRFKMEVSEDTRQAGGLTIFGKNYGNYNQDISVRINYSDISTHSL